jgi:hypothetical protein
MSFRRESRFPTTDVAARLVDAVTRLGQEVRGLHDTLTGQPLQAEDALLTKALSRVRAASDLVALSRRELTRRKGEP